MMRKRFLFGIKGFTLVEAMVAVVVVGIIGYILSDLIVRGFKGSAKTQLIGTIKQNGQAAINSLDQTIRNADSIVCPNQLNPTATIAPSKILTVSKKGIYTRVWFTDPVGTINGYLSSDSPILTSQLDASKLCDLQDGVPTNPGPVTSNRTEIIKNNSVSVQNGSFLRIKKSGFKDGVTIYFELVPDLRSVASFENQIGSPLQFQTTVQLR